MLLAWKICWVRSPTDTFLYAEEAGEPSGANPIWKK